MRRAEDFGWDSQAIEAQAFAFLGVRSLKGLPLTFPTTTGVPEPMTGGALAGGLSVVPQKGPSDFRPRRRKADVLRSFRDGKALAAFAIAYQ